MESGLPGCPKCTRSRDRLGWEREKKRETEFYKESE